jgi:MoxR-like ATPase
MTNQIAELERNLRDELGKYVYGMDEAIHFLLLSLVARGHVLLEGSPGIGKTLLSKSLATTLGGRFRRIQGTADLMPTDITGVNVYDKSSGQFRFEQGPLFADVVLFDEINRAGPKTQSALLEAMEERQVTADGDSHPLPEEFFVIATQNPFEYEGTYPLPESELDRFLIMLDLGYPAREAEAQVLQKYTSLANSSAASAPPGLSISSAAIDAARAEVDSVHMADEVIAYILDIAQATRESERLSLGLSTRGTLALAKCARIEAAMRGGDYVIPDDIQAVAPYVASHRVVLTPDAVLQDVDARRHVVQLIASITVPR